MVDAPEVVPNYSINHLKKRKLRVNKASQLMLRNLNKKLQNVLKQDYYLLPPKIKNGKSGLGT